MNFLPIIGIFANIVLQAVGAAGVLAPATTNLIESLIGNISPLIATLFSGQPKVQDVLAVLAGLSAIITTLEQDTNLPADRLARLKLLDGEVSAAISAYVKAGAGFDATTYTQISPVD
ncbi:MAG TPA: hypothetical protein VGK96_28380 [Candidatus Sulfotelmatobacter sp.]